MSSIKLRVILLAGLILLVALAGAIAFRPVYDDYRTTAGLSTATISSIQIHPNGDWPIVTLDSAEEIDGFIAWLGSTRNATRLRSDPPPIVFDGSIRFRDGRTEPFRMSAVLVPKTDTSSMNRSAKHSRRLLDPRSDVLVRLRGLTRSGERSRLVKVIQSNDR